KRSSLWPSIPRKLTDDRSGSLRFASPLSCARALAAQKTAASVAAPSLPALIRPASRFASGQAFFNHVRIDNPPSRIQSYSNGASPAGAALVYSSFPAHYLHRTLGSSRTGSVLAGYLLAPTRDRTGTCGRGAVCLTPREGSTLTHPRVRAHFETKIYNIWADARSNRIRVRNSLEFRPSEGF